MFGLFSLALKVVSHVRIQQLKAQAKQLGDEFKQYFHVTTQHAAAAVAQRPPMPGLSVTMKDWAAHRTALGQVDSKAQQRLTAMGKSEMEWLARRAAQLSPRSRYHQSGRPRFADSWQVSWDGDTWRLRNVALHAGWVLNPTAPHTIVARRAAVLRFVGAGGSVVYRRRVHHPGTKGNPMVAQLARELQDHVQRSLHQVALDVCEDIRASFR